MKTVTIEDIRKLNNSIRELKGSGGLQGEQGIQGIQGIPGSDANVTKANVEAVLTGDISSHAHTGTYATNNDARLSDARTPTAHNQTWSTITSTPTNLVGYGITDAAPAVKGVTNGDTHDHVGGDGNQIDHTGLANKGTNTHAQIDTFIASKAATSGLASLDANSKLGQARARADDGLGYVQLTNDTLAQAYATNNTTKLTVTANRTLTTTVPPAGCRAYTIILTSGTSSFTITFGAGFKPTTTLATGTTSGRVFVIHWISDGTNLYEAGRTAAMVA